MPDSIKYTELRDSTGHLYDQMDAECIAKACPDIDWMMSVLLKALEGSDMKAATKSIQQWRDYHGFLIEMMKRRRENDRPN